LIENRHIAVKRCRHGLFMYNRHDSFVGRGLDLYGEWCDFEIKMLNQFIKPGDTVIDAGANIGTHTIALGNTVGPTGMVHAFEPQPRLFAMLAGNVALNALDWVVCHQQAVGDMTGTIQVPPLPPPERSCNFSLVSLVQGQSPSQGDKPVEAPLIILDSLDLKDCAAIKIDVEGMESKVLAGAHNLIKRCQPALYIEANSSECTNPMIEFFKEWEAPKGMTPERRSELTASYAKIKTDMAAAKEEFTPFLASSKDIQNYLKLEGKQVGFHRKIREPTINRPGLALSGFYSYFAEKRVQVLGAAENTYLKSLSARVRIQRFRELCAKKIPCLIVSRGAHLAPELVAVAEEEEVAIFRTPMITMKFINAATIALEVDFAPSVTEFGSMVDILGVGVLIRGQSGIGKSECVLGLIERGYSLVADDVTRIKSFEGRELVATAPELTRYHMEVRGIGIINVASIFGIGAIRIEKRLDLVATLKDWQELEEVDRIGLDQEFYEILKLQVPHVTIPVRPGRDIARLIEVAAMDQKLKGLGRNSALEFNTKLLNLMQDQKI
jgi:HPr kinase/phosphorylase